MVDPSGDPAPFRSSFAAAVENWSEVRSAEDLLQRFRSEGFGGAPVAEVDFCHSDVAWVFTRKQGIPIALGVIVVEAARRCALASHGINFPGHFLVSVDDELVDPLSMRVLRPGELQTGRHDINEMLARATPLMVAMRMLNNLKALHVGRGSLHEALDIVDFQIALDDANAESVASLLFERGEFWRQLGAASAARSAFEECVALSPFPKLTEEAQNRIERLGGTDETWH